MFRLPGVKKSLADFGITASSPDIDDDFELFGSDDEVCYTAEVNVSVEVNCIKLFYYLLFIKG